MAINKEHPGIENLKPITSKEMSEQYRLRGLETRRKNKEKKELAKQTIIAMKELGDEAPDAMAALNCISTGNGRR